MIKNKKDLTLKKFKCRKITWYVFDAYIIIFVAVCCKIDRFLELNCLKYGAVYSTHSIGLNETMLLFPAGFLLNWCNNFTLKGLLEGVQPKCFTN